MTYPIKSPRKLIEVALPLDAINVACAKEKSIRHGHPSTLHLWWARRPLAAARAVLFAQLVNDPGFQRGGGFQYGKNKKDAAIERRRLFKIIEELVVWENTANEDLLERARIEIRRSWQEVCELNKEHPQAPSLFNPHQLPAFHDPFAGGGAIPLEAQRLGLEAHASDLNPVAVLINKAMIEIPAKFSGLDPVGPEAELPQKSRKLGLSQSWPGATGLAADVRRYGSWMRNEAQRRIGHLYPPVTITSEMASQRPDLKPLLGKTLTIIAALWARTVKSPSPAFSDVEVPLASTFVLSSKPGRESYVQPIINGHRYDFEVKKGKPPPEAEAGTKIGRGANFSCLVSGAAIEPKYIYAEALAGRMSARLMAIVAEHQGGRIYLTPPPGLETLSLNETPSWKPELLIPNNPRWFSPPLYGLTTYGDLFTARQLTALTTFGDLVNEVRDRIRRDAIDAGRPDDGRGLEAGGTGATAYAQAVSVYLAFAVSKATDRNSSLCFWESPMDRLRGTFGRQALAMVWDYAETNPFAGAGGDIYGTVESLCEVLDNFLIVGPGFAEQADAQTQNISAAKIVSTDPPYYDNIGYADLSDFFYVWLRRSLRSEFPSLFATLGVPKAEELVATPYRHGGKENAESFFMKGMANAMSRISLQAHPAFPITIYYAFKQAETKDAETSSTGWETFLEAVISAGFTVDGTWPMRTELTVALKKKIGALASSIILVCQKRSEKALTISRREFLRELNAVLPEALDEMTKGSGDDRSPVAPVDLSQAIIGPGMAVFSKYAAVLEADGSRMTVRAALQLINRFLGEDDFDRDTQFCLSLFQQNGWKEGRFGEADTLARAKGTSVDRVKDAGLIDSAEGAVRILKWSAYDLESTSKHNVAIPVWGVLHRLVRALRETGEGGAGRELAGVRGQGESVRQLAYRLYTLCEREGWAEDARTYNELITSWTGIEAAAGTMPSEKQRDLFGGDRSA